MEPAPQGEMWLDDTQMAHTVETSICLCIKTTGFIGSLWGLYGFQPTVLQVVTLWCVEKSGRQLWQELLRLLSEYTHLFALIQFIQTKWQKSFVCLSSNVLINAFVSVRKKKRFHSRYVILMILIFFSSCIDLSWLWDLSPLVESHSDYAPFARFIYCTSAKSVLIDCTAQLTWCCQMPICPPQNRLYLTTCVTVSSLCSSCLPPSLWWLILCPSLCLWISFTDHMNVFLRNVCVTRESPQPPPFRAAS